MQSTNLLHLIFRYVLSAGLLAASVTAMAEDGPAETAKPVVVLETTLGEIVLQLDPVRSPLSVANFLEYVDSGHYDNTVFHRVIPRFMVQGGGFTQGLKEKPTRDPIVNESKNRWHNERGTVAMARTNHPDSATAQFFINVKMNLPLDYRAGKAGYAVFGEVIDGMATVDAITWQPTSTIGGYSDVPNEPIVLIKASRRP
ncbi:MAG: cyclophilin family peptidyl-prolyl cis-trans isomerase [Halieaceae bacterium]|jgi:cyclophilin family peptidyl-prolyl cis-trans isomerase